MVARLAPAPTDLLSSLRQLREEARVDQPRAVLFASMIVATLFAAAGASRQWATAPPAPAEDVLVDTFDHFRLEPPPAIEPPGSRTVLPTVSPAAPFDPHAVPNVVPVAPETPVVTPTSGTGVEGAEPSTPTGPPGPVHLAPAKPEPESVPSPWETHDVEPDPLFTPRPEYPDLARQAAVEGTVVLRALVERDGRVGEIRVERSVPLLDVAARDAIARWTFAPARTNGVAVRAWVLVPVRFSLHDGR